MNEQPEALRLADAMESHAIVNSNHKMAAAELRRLYAEVEQLREQNTALDAACARLEAQRDELLEALNRMVCNPNAPNLAFARAAIAKCK